VKILFITKIENFIAPLGLILISSIAKEDGHETFLCDMAVEDPLERVASLRPEVVAYSASSGEAKHYVRLNGEIKRKFPQIFTVMGGPHPTFFPEFLKDTTLDAACVGEGEGAFHDLLGALSAGHAVDTIPNIVTREQGALPRLRDLVANLDSLPFPDYTLFYDNSPMGKYPLKSFMIGRGCPYDCTYCFNACWRRMYRGKGNYLRRHSVDYVIEDIRRVMVRWPLSCVKFYDDIFCYRADEWLEEFSRKYREKVNIPFFILTRADLLSKDVVELLKYAGCRTISMSIEAGNERLRNRILKRNMTDEQILPAYRLCESYGIYTFTNCIIGLPESLIENDIESVNLSIRAKATWAEFPIFFPYPGTELGDRVIGMGMYTPDYEEMHTSYMFRSPLNCFTKREKNVQMNLSVLGSVAVVFPRLKNLIVNYLIYWPHNRFFTFAYYLVKMFVLRRKIYVTKTGLWTSLRIFLKSLRQEFFKHTEEE
jgi:anaerobic magnesium-protoporphyrin IX monomethyl ester cyclase